MRASRSPSLLPLACLAYATLFAGAGIWIILRDGPTAVAEVAIGGRPVLAVVMGALLGSAVSVGMHASPLARTRTLRRLRRFLRPLLGSLPPAHAWVLALLSGVAEESFFRGALQPAVGLLPASLIFGALHLPPDRRLVAWPVFAGLVGLALGGLYEITGNLLGPILAHSLINLISLRRIATPTAGPGASKRDFNDAAPPF